MIQICYRMLFVYVFAKLASHTWAEQEVARQTTCIMKYFKNLQSNNIIPQLYLVDDHGKEKLTNTYFNDDVPI